MNGSEYVERRVKRFPTVAITPLMLRSLTPAQRAALAEARQQIDRATAEVIERQKARRAS